MAREPNVARVKWDELTGKLEMEFKLPNISSPWLKKVFELRNDILDWSKVPMADSEMIQALDFPPLKSVNLNFGVEKEVTLTRVSSFCHMQSYVDNSVERVGYSETVRRIFQGGSSFPVGWSLRDQPHAEPDEEIWCDVPLTYVTRLDAEVTAEGFGENEI